MGKSIGFNAEGLLDSLSDVKKPEIADLCRKLKRYADAEKSIVSQLNTTRKKASGLVVYGLQLESWAKKTKGADAEAFKKRAKEFDQAITGLECFSDAIDALLEGGSAGKVKLPGDTLQKVLDKLEFTDKASAATMDNVRKAAKDYYPAESAGQKKLAEWSVQLGQLAVAVNKGLAELDPNDKVQALNLSFGRFEVLKPALELKKKIDALGV